MQRTPLALSACTYHGPRCYGSRVYVLNRLVHSIEADLPTESWNEPTHVHARSQAPARNYKGGRCSDITCTGARPSLRSRSPTALGGHRGKAQDDGILRFAFGPLQWQIAPRTRAISRETAPRPDVNSESLPKHHRNRPLERGNESGSSGLGEFQPEGGWMGANFSSILPSPQRRTPTPSWRSMRDR